MDDSRRRPAPGHRALVLTTLLAVTTAVVATFARSGAVEALALLAAACTGAALQAACSGLRPVRPDTGLLDAAGLRTAGDALLAAARRHGYPVTAVVAQVEEADRAQLALVARTWRATARRGDLLARVGGSFVLLLPGSTPAVAEPLLARLRGAVDGRWASGLALAGPDDDVEGLLQAAERDLARVQGLRPDVPAPRPAAEAVRQA